MNQNTITCPNCSTEIDISQSLYAKLEQQAQAKLQQEINEHRSKYKEAMESLKSKEESIQAQKERFDKELAKATETKVQEQLKFEKRKLHEELKAQIVSEREEEMQLLAKELQEKSKQVQELHTTKAEVLKLQREKEELGAKAKVEAEIELTKQLSLEKEKIQKNLEEENSLKLRAKDEQIEQMRRDIESAKRKADQGSQQIQGEAQELAIETWLSSQFPFDNIDEVKKGVFGADCVQTIHTRELQNCGIICYESKNAKTWSAEWINKLKVDMLKVHADIGVLVTTVMPKELDRMGFVDGIWVCSLDEFKGSVSLLRESLIRVHQSVQKEENKTDKMTLLYNYLGSNEFSLQLNSIVDGFIKMQEELDKERRSLMASWKRRQKLIDGVLVNTTEMYGSLQGIAGNAIGHIPTLELPFEEEDEG